MQLVAGSVARTKTNLNLRTGPGAQHSRLATLQTGVLVTALEAPAAGWVKVKTTGYAHKDDPNTIYSEPDERSSIDAKRGTSDWRTVTISGHVSVRYLIVEDGPA